MRLIGLAVVLAFALVLAPLAVGLQPAAKIAQSGANHLDADAVALGCTAVTTEEAYRLVKSLPVP